uniref:Uncharacterized protein n=1 Tax=Nicotiana tabacum TaxID=4097 RepID=A0A1S3YXV9_TOBAC|nr:PREDICTED: uncharacterized protein LOC107780835 [Nicotiana tabacum]
MDMNTKDFKKYLRRGKCSSRNGNYSKSKAPEKQTNDSCYKYGKTDHHIKNYESSDDDEDEQAVMAIGESDEETEGVESQKSEDSFKYATEREETVSSETEEVKFGPKVTSVVTSKVTANLETRFVLEGKMTGVDTAEFEKMGGKNKKGKEKESEGAQGDVRGMGQEVAESSPTPVGLTDAIGVMEGGSEESTKKEKSVKEKGGSGSGEAAEGLIRLGKKVQEPVPSEQEPLEDLLKKVCNSYNPTKKRSSRVKVPSTGRANKKRKAASSIPVETSPTRGRATRSQKKQSEAELEKALKEKEVEEMEVVTPKANKIKTSTMKSASKTKSAGPSSLVKRTRYTLKSRKVKTVEKKNGVEKKKKKKNLMLRRTR